MNKNPITATDPRNRFASYNERYAKAAKDLYHAQLNQRGIMKSTRLQAAYKKMITVISSGCSCQYQFRPKLWRINPSKPQHGSVWHG